MKFLKTKINGVYVIELQPYVDQRGIFARAYCQDEFSINGLNHEIKQCNISFNPHQGTLRGMHFQKKPFEEAKTVRCFRGAIYDVALDIREESKTFGNWFGTVLSESNNLSLYIPEGCAHGFLTLEEKSIVYYQVSTPYYPEAEEGIRWDDPLFNIEWPIEINIISDKDKNYPDFVA